MTYYADESFCPERSIGYLVRRVHQLGNALLEPIFAEEGLTHSQWSTMIAIYLGSANTCAALARDVGHDKGAMTRIIDQLEARGFLRRERDTDDRRIVNIIPTEAGIEAGLRIKAKVIDVWNEWLGVFDAGEIDVMINHLNRLKSRLDQLVVPEQAE